MFKNIKYLLRQYPDLLDIESQSESDSIDSPRNFINTEGLNLPDNGDSAFGKWILDDAGLPAYEYELDQLTDPIAEYINSERLNRQDHWHQIGNNSIIGLVSNDGVIQAVICDRGVQFLNHYDPKYDVGCYYVVFAGLLHFAETLVRRILTIGLPQNVQHNQAPTQVNPITGIYQALRSRNANRSPHAYVGGYGYVDAGDDVKGATAYRYLPNEHYRNKARRIFGMGYFETHTTYPDLQIVRRVYAPNNKATDFTQPDMQDDSVLIVDVEITNLAPTKRPIRYYEYWDVNPHQAELQWVRTGFATSIGDDERRRLNLRFNDSIEWLEEHQTIRFRQTRKNTQIERDTPNFVDYFPPEIFLTSLNQENPSEHYYYAHDFFGDGDAVEPEVVRDRLDRRDVEKSDKLLPYCMVMRYDFELDSAGTGSNTKTLRFMFGAVNEQEELEPLIQRYRNDVSLATIQANWRNNLCYFSTGTLPQLQREIAWHSYYLLSSVVYNEYFDVNLTPQGSAYLYLHGADGVPRDFALYIIALTYIHPELSKDMLRLIMQMTERDSHQIEYAMSGHGKLDGGGVHDEPSDLDIFFLLAVQEYFAATADYNFLDEQVDYYPLDPASSPLPTVLDHILAAIDHLIDEIGLGDNGLIRISDGDWSDAVVITNVLNGKRANWFSTRDNGESIPNSQMALYVLPRIANLLQRVIELKNLPDVRPYIDKIDDFVSGLQTAVQKQGQGDFYPRAILRGYFNRPILLNERQMDIEAQVWALIAGLETNNGQLERLANKIHAELDEPSPIGALMTDGSVWPAISQLLTWGYTRVNRAFAWETFRKNAMYTKSTVFPETWFTVWSGPDGIYAAKNLAHLPGTTWSSPLTPMTDFPIFNNNVHAMMLIGLLRVCGIEPTQDGDGLIITPHTPEHYRFESYLLDVSVAERHISGRYHMLNPTSINLYFKLDDFKQLSQDDIQITVNDNPVTSRLDNDTLVLNLESTQSGMDFVFNIEWQADL